MDKFISTKDVCELIGLSRTQITAKDKNDGPREGMEDFPEALHIGYRRLYSLDEVQEWQRKRLLERTPPPKRRRKTQDADQDQYAESSSRTEDETAKEDTSTLATSAED